MLRRVLTLVGVVLLTAQPAAAQLPRTLDLEAMRAIVVQHDGRWQPLDTLARDYVESVTGDVFFDGHDPVLLLLAWTFDPHTWSRRPLIDISNAELRAELRLSPTKEVFSYAELADNRDLLARMQAVSKKEGKLDPLESKLGGIYGKLGKLSEIFGGQAIRSVPHPTDANAAWFALPPAEGGDAREGDAVHAAWLALGNAFTTDDRLAFTAASGRFKAALQARPAAHRPDPDLIATELHYNALQPYTAAWKLMGLGAVLSALAMLVRRRWFDVVAVTALMSGFGVLTYGLSLRWQIAGRIPAANMFESLLFLSWGMGVFAILAMVVQRQRMVPLTASVMGALALFLADVLPLDSFVRPIAPVLLDTVWMSIHVPIIMISYSVLALAVLVAHVQLVQMAVAPGRRELAVTIDAMHYWYVHVGSFLLLVGILTGSMWAASSWGRYWGWDPKEVWSLVAFLGYMAILHVRIDHTQVPSWMYAVAAALGVCLFVIVIPKFGPLTGAKLLAFAGTAAAMVFLVVGHGIFATALKSILAFWLIIMTYIGVNYVLGIGLHSYGFGTGAAVKYMMLTGTIDLALIGVCCIVYIARRPARVADGTDMAAA